MRKPPVIVIAEDQPEEALLLRLGFEATGQNYAMHFMEDGQQVIQYLSRIAPFHDRTAHPLPDLLLLDLKMPGVDGFQVLRWIRQRVAFDGLLVAVLSGSEWPGDIERARGLGANFYMVKPFAFEQLVQELQRLGEHHLAWAKTHSKGPILEPPSAPGAGGFRLPGLGASRASSDVPRMVRSPPGPPR